MAAWAKPSTIMHYTTTLIVQSKPLPIGFTISFLTKGQQLHYYVSFSCTKQDPHTGPMSLPQTCSKLYAKQSQASAYMNKVLIQTLLECTQSKQWCNGTQTEWQQKYNHHETWLLDIHDVPAEIILFWCSEVVITLDFESSIRGSNPRTRRFLLCVYVFYNTVLC